MIIRRFNQVSLVDIRGKHLHPRHFENKTATYLEWPLVTSSYESDRYHLIGRLRGVEALECSVDLHTENEHCYIGNQQPARPWK